MAPRSASRITRAGRTSGPLRGLGHVRVVGDLDPVALRRADDLLPSPLLRGRALELRLVPSRHRVADVGLVVDREVLAAVAVDVRELIGPEVVALPLGQ